MEHTARGDAAVSSGGVISNNIVNNDNLEMKGEHDNDSTARSSEIELYQMALAFSDNGKGMWIEHRNERTEDEIEIVSPDRSPQHIKQPSGSGGDDVYVAVGKSDSSLNALSWALKNVAKPGSFVYLIHVFPEVHQIPTPLGPVHKSQLTEDQVENYMNQERGKRRQMLQRYLNLCRTSRVEYDVHLIESNQTENAILELIPVLNIQVLVIGTSKSNLRRLKRGGTKAGIIQKNAPDYCEVKIICDGKDVSTITSTPNPTPPISPLAPGSAKTEREVTPKESPSPEPISMIRNGSTNSRKENKFKKFFRFFSCKSGIDIHMG